MGHRTQRRREKLGRSIFRCRRRRRRRDFGIYRTWRLVHWGPFDDVHTSKTIEKCRFPFNVSASLTHKATIKKIIIYVWSFGQSPLLSKEDICVLCTRNFPTSGNYKETMHQPPYTKRILRQVTQLSLTILFFSFYKFTHPWNLFFLPNLSIVEASLKNNFDTAFWNAHDRCMTTQHSLFKKLYNAVQI